MHYKLAATLSCMVFSCAMYAQNGWLPPVSFPLHTQLCDNTDWKLVLYDDFNGTTLNPQWFTYNTFRGMQPAENDNSADSRKYGGVTGDNESWNSVLLDQNVVVSNGTCKLLVKHEPVVLTCPVCPVTPTRYYSVGELYTPYLRGNTNDGNTNWFNTGKFEVKMKMPYYNKAHTTVWTWPSALRPDYGVDEIDMAESYGRGNTLTTVNNYNLHAWGPPDASYPNEYHLPSNATIGELYPRQSWWNTFFNNRLNIADWHTYTCEWDTTSIKLYLDNQLFKYIPKYYYTKVERRWILFRSYFYLVNVAADCITDQSQPYKITYAFPYFDKPLCNFRITTAVDGTQSETVPTTTSTLLGQAEIDYVKIWQRHPGEDGHNELCADNTYPAEPTISGPTEVCPIGAYTVSTAIAGGEWAASGHFALSNTTGSTATLYKNAGPAFNGGWISYKYGNGVVGCPSKAVFKYNLYCNESTDWQIMQPTILNTDDMRSFYFISDLYNIRDMVGGYTPVVTWNISVNIGQDFYDEHSVQNYTLYGQYASSPSFSTSGNQSYNLRWTINVTDPSGTWTRSGERNSKTALNQQKNDTNTYYLNAYIGDQDRYDTTVYNGVASEMVSEEESNDTSFVNELIGKVMANALEPYIITDGMESAMNKGNYNFDKSDNEGSLLKVYPNPVQSIITIIADSRFVDKEPVVINVYDLSGKLIKRGKINYSKGNIMKYDLSDIMDGNYILELHQGTITEHLKITKAKNN